MSKPYRVLLVIEVACILAAAAAGSWVGLGSPAWWMPIAFTGCVWLAEVYTFRIVVSRQAITYSLSDAFLAVAFVLAPGSWSACCFGIAVLASHWYRAPPVKVWFNLVQNTCAAAVGAAVAHSVASGVSGAAVGLVTYAILNHLLVTTAIATVSGQPLWRVLPQSAPLNVVYSAGNISLGLAAGWIAAEVPLALAVLVVPMVLLHSSHRRRIQQAQQTRLFAEVARGQEELAQYSVDLSAQVIVTATARMFGDAETEMLLRHPDGPVRYLRDERGALSRQRVASGVFDEWWVLRTLGSRGAVSGVEPDGQLFCSVAIGPAGSPRAVLIVRRTTRSAHTEFGHGDEKLMEVLAEHAQSWLAAADLDTTPAMALLRESTDRLSRLAGGVHGPDARHTIIEELQAVERAGASLLGTIALTTARSAPTTDHPPEWTSTGRLLDSDR